MIAAACAAAGYWAGDRRSIGAPPSFRQLTFRRGIVNSARFAPDGQTVIYAGRWDGKPRQLFSLRIDTAESTALPLPEANILSVSKFSELAILKVDGVMARVPLGGRGARDIADNVLAGDWAPDGTTMALVRYEGARQWLEYPVGRTIFRPTDVFQHAAKSAGVSGRRVGGRARELIRLERTPHCRRSKRCDQEPVAYREHL
jgi:hypothetical protein